MLGYRGLFGALAVVGGISTLMLMGFVPETLPPQRRLLPTVSDMPLTAIDLAGVNGAPTHGE